LASIASQRESPTTKAPGHQDQRGLGALVIPCPGSCDSGHDTGDRDRFASCLPPRSACRYGLPSGRGRTSGTSGPSAIGRSIGGRAETVAASRP
jgi:hypothetical protein